MKRENVIGRADVEDTPAGRLRRKLEPGKPEQTPYESKAEFLPRSLDEAIGHLKASKVLREGLGSGFIDYYCRIKEAEIARFNLEVSEWEHREYFDLL